MKPQIGSISHGTLRTEDLISIFLETLKGLDNLSAEHTHLVAWLSSGPGDDTFLEELFNALDERSPSNCYFGAHIGDSSDFGWWRNEEELSLEELEEMPWEPQWNTLWEAV